MNLIYLLIREIKLIQSYLKNQSKEFLIRDANGENFYMHLEKFLIKFSTTKTISHLFFINSTKIFDIFGQSMTTLIDKNKSNACDVATCCFNVYAL